MYLQARKLLHLTSGNELPCRDNQAVLQTLRPTRDSIKAKLVAVRYFSEPSAHGRQHCCVIFKHSRGQQQRQE